MGLQPITPHDTTVIQKLCACGSYLQRHLRSKLTPQPVLAQLAGAQTDPLASLGAGRVQATVAKQMHDRRAFLITILPHLPI